MPVCATTTEATSPTGALALEDRLTVRSDHMCQTRKDLFPVNNPWERFVGLSARSVSGGCVPNHVPVNFAHLCRTIDWRIAANTVRVREDGATARHDVGPNATMPRLEIRRLAHEPLLPRQLRAAWCLQRLVRVAACPCDAQATMPM